MCERDGAVGCRPRVWGVVAVFLAKMLDHGRVGAGVAVASYA